MKETELRQRRTTSLEQPPTTHRGEMIEVSCHCRGVQLRIAPPPYTSSSEGWYVPSDRSKYYTRLCCCRSCSLTLGFSLQPWAYIPPSQICTTNNEPFIFGPRAKGTVQIDKLKYYQSSRLVLRSFVPVAAQTCFIRASRDHISLM